MNFRLIARVLGGMLMLAAVCMLPSLLLALAEADGAAHAFLAAMAVCLLCAAPMVLLKPRSAAPMQLRDGFAAAAGCWLCLSLVSALPYWFSGALAQYPDALFEAVSGLTTTGASVIADVEALPRSLLLWRSLTHFIGGMGVLLLMLALLPKLGAGSGALMKAESPGPIKSKLVPRLGQTAKLLYSLYLTLIALETLCLRLAGMGWFDSFCHAVSTIATGGFSTKNAGIAAFHSPLIVWIITAFTLLAGVNYSLLFLLLRRQVRSVLKNEELRLYLALIAGASVLILAALVLQNGAPLSFSTLTDAVFESVTLITTTGFSLVDYNPWPTLAHAVILLLILSGGCAGSTAGGVKPVRLLLLCKLLRRSVDRVLHPRQVRVIRLDGRRVSEETLNAVCVFFFSYCLLLVAGTLLLSLDNLGITTAFSAALTSLSNVGPGLDVIGPCDNFAPLSAFSKLVLSLLMLSGRLEILPLLVLLHPSAWRRPQ